MYTFYLVLGTIEGCFSLLIDAGLDDNLALVDEVFESSDLAHAIENCQYFYGMLYCDFTAFFQTVAIA